MQKYDPNSIVDTLKKAGAGSDFNSRYKLATSLGINNYTGTGDQNTDLIRRYSSQTPTVGAPGATGNPPTGSVSTTPPPPTGTSTVTRYTSPYDTASEEYYNNLKKEFTSTDEAAVREQARKQVQAQIDSINTAEDINRNKQVEQNKQNTGRTRSILSSSGLQGSGRGLTTETNTENYNNEQLSEIEAGRSARINAILAGVDQRANEEIKAQKEAAKGNRESYLAFLKDNEDNAKTDIVNLAKLGVKQSQLDPLDIEDLLKHSGYSKQQFDAIWNAHLPIIKATTGTTGGAGGGGTAGTGGKLSALAQAVQNGTISLDKLTPTDRARVAAELSGAGIPSGRAETLQANLGVVNSLIDNPNTKKISGYIQGKLGLGNVLPGAQLALNQYKQLKGILSLENREKLKGSGAISDFEFQVLSDAATALGRNLSDSDFQDQLTIIKDVFEGKYANLNNQGDGTISSDGTAIQAPGGNPDEDPEIQQLRDQGYSDEQIQQIING